MPLKTIQISLCLFVFCAFICGGLLVYSYYKDYENEEYFSDLKTTANSISVAPKQKSTSVSSIITEEKPVIDVPVYDHLFAQNQDMVAWLEIAGTTLSYPVMHTPKTPDYYLRKNFEMQYSEHGTPYLAEACNLVESDNLIVYGHNFKSYKMFGLLMKYKDADYLQQHPFITLQTKTELRTYKIFSVALTSAFSPDIDTFPFYIFTKANTVTDYSWYLSNLQKHSVYDTAISPPSGAQLITLVTCEYSQTNGRMLVVGYLDSTYPI